MLFIDYVSSDAEAGAEGRKERGYAGRWPCCGIRPSGERLSCATGGYGSLVPGTGTGTGTRQRWCSAAMCLSAMLCICVCLE